MQSIIASVLENLKKEVEDFYGTTPSLEEVEEFTWTKMKAASAEMAKAYAEETDRALYEDREGRKQAGLAVERRGESRTILTDIGEFTFQRTYYAQKDGTYDYPVDRILGIDPRQRVSNRVQLRLVREVKDGSYANASRIVAEGEISRQTVMNAVRRCQAKEGPVEQRRVPVLHIDADEDHVSLQNGKTLIVPLVTVYEGIEKTGDGKQARRRCINVFHYSACKTGEEFWDEVYERIISRYDLKETRIYLHGDGAAWIRQGLEYLPNSTFVLDCYHKNKAKKMVFAGCRRGEAQLEKNAVINALRYGNGNALIDAGERLAAMHPERKERIEKGLEYLYQNLNAIAIQYQDPEARNGGATEPHVSHVLSRRLSSRPMGWSIQTLEHLVPILAVGSFDLIPKDRRDDLPDCLERAATKAAKVIKTKKKMSPFLVDPDKSVSFEVIKNGRVTQLYCAMKGLGW